MCEHCSQEDREKILDEVRAVWRAHPKMRFGQLVVNIGRNFNYGDIIQRDIFDIEDKIFFRYANRDNFLRRNNITCRDTSGTATK